MPMPNNNFHWRPNDNGPLTNIRYNLEASKWVKAVDSAQKSIPKGNYGADLGFIGALIQIPLLLLFFIFMIPIAIAREVFNYNIKIFPGDKPTGPILTDRQKWDAEMAEIKRKYPPKKRRSTWEDLPEKEREMVRFVREQTAKD